MSPALCLSGLSLLVVAAKIAAMNSVGQVVVTQTGVRKGVGDIKGIRGIALDPMFCWLSGGMADTQDLKSCERKARAGSTPASAIVRGL